MNKWLILFCAFLVFVSACRDIESKIDDLAAECTSGDQEACKKLADIAKNDEDRDIREAAVENLTDQKVLASIAKSDTDWTVRRAAVMKLTDQTALAEVAMEVDMNDEDRIVREAALENLTDQTVLAKIALEDSFLGYSALEIMATQNTKTKVAVDDKDWRVHLIFKFIAAFDSVPTMHRERLMKQLLTVMRVLSYPEVVSAVGNIVSIKTEWNGTNRSYTGGSMNGEIFTCSIKVKKLSEPLSYTWITSFPILTTSLGFRSAGVNAADLLKKLFEKITDQKLLFDIAENEKNSWVRIAAAEKLIDQTVSQAVFVEIAKKDKYSEFRMAAVEKLTDQKLLAEIARNDADEYVRRAAIAKLTDQAALTDIAKNDKVDWVRIAAEERLKELQGK